MRRLAALLALTTVAGPLAAQYFGQNKVQYRTFDFKIIQTEHFEVYYYPQERAAALDAARMAERGYARLSRILHHQFTSRKPIILYASQSDFQQTNVVDASGEGLGGVTEFFKHRMVLPFTGSYAELEHVLQHEMVHQFQYDVYSRGRAGAGVQTLITVNPPLWFMEGMAEYLSLGPIDPNTAMWLRDASLEGHLPTIEEMTYDPNVFPYYYGHALWAYIGEKWGDEVIGEILQASANSGVEPAVKRALGLSLDQLSDEWRDAVQTTFLPQLGDHYRARRVAQATLTRKRSHGRLFVAPALTPDGREIAFFGDQGGFFVDLWLADAETGRVKRRLVKSTLNNNYESLRFINSAGAFSPDGRYFAIAAKRKDRDDLVILDVKRGREERRIQIPLNGLITPNWSPDGSQLVFTGFDGGLSDLFIINRDGTGMRRLTNDKYADLQPAWSPDGKTIAFATDRGRETDFDELRFGKTQIALYHLDTGTIELLGHMEQGNNINPAWAPDGRSLAFVSDRTGISNVYLLDFGDGNIYQLTNLYTGVQGFTPLSPVMSWARQADRLAFVYYEEGQYSVYSVDNPRSLRHGPFRAPSAPPVTSLLAAGGGVRDSTPAAQGASTGGTVPGMAPAPVERANESRSVYRSSSGFRPSASPQAAESLGAPGPVSVRQLLDSAALALPDTNEFTFRSYRTRFTPDYVARPTVGYQRDNFGRGFFGGTAVALSDILGNHTIILSGAVNGRISEAQFLGVYVNQAHRFNWAAGFSQEPLYFYDRSSWERVPCGNCGSVDSVDIFTTRIRRFVIRDLFGESYYPFSRFSRVEVGVHAVNITDDTLALQTGFGAVTPTCCSALGPFLGQQYHTGNGSSISFAQPSLALVHDNSLFGYVGPFAGSRSRFQISPAIGDWQFTAGLADYRRYLYFRPFTLAFRGLTFGRYGRDAERFPMFLGSTELLRGYTFGSFRSNECVADPGSASQTGCAELDQLIGSKIAVANVELRFPLTRSLVLGFLPVGFPPIEGALFYDAGVAWGEGTVLKSARRGGENPEFVRTPLRSWGGSIRANMLGFLIMRFDYAKPLDRPQKKSYWTISLGPTF
ncbi:MAG TPA: BamA/TamA family outer membrane protein [Gemmatimonadales bacterium]|jgi:Tol biopolymer transport system component|nr:BamA/TamA family outer membrane protein [Gemmatimonadales bacterium]